MNKIAMFAFRGDLLCFVHVLLNALDVKERGGEAAIIFEGESVTLVEQLEKEGAMFRSLYIKAKEAGLIAGACKACSAKLGAFDAVREAGLPFLDEMQGHPSMASWISQGYTVITF